MVTYDNTTATGWHHGFPDDAGAAGPGTAQRALGQAGAVLPGRDFVNARRQPHAQPRQTSRVLKRAEKMGFQVMTGHGVRGFNSPRRRELGGQEGGCRCSRRACSVTAAAHEPAPRFFNAITDEMLAFRAPVEGLHGDRPWRVRGGHRPSEALEQADRAVLFKTGTRSARASASCPASWLNRTRRCPAAAHPPEPSDGKSKPVPRTRTRGADEQAVRATWRARSPA